MADTKYVFLVLLALQCASSYKILIIPGLSVTSQYLYMSKIGEVLATAGHDVTFLLGENHNDVKKTPLAQELLTFEKYHTVLDKTMFEKLNSLFISKALTGQFEIKDTMILTNGLYEDCKQILANKELLQRLESAKFDIVVANNMPLCHVLIAQKLDLPVVSASTNRPIPAVDTYWINMPSPVSYVPGMMSALSDKMSFLQRVKNLMMQTAGFLFANLMVLSPYDELKQLHNIKPEISVRESIARAEFYLFSVDWALEYPRPLMPNTVYIGGLMAKETTPLNKEWEEFVNSAEHGIVVFSFGSVANPGANLEVAEKLTAALARLPQKVVMRYVGETPKNLGNNTKLTKWMPQNDLLGNPQTKAFVSHGGMNGVFEAIHHGVPMVGIPLYGDHFDNIFRLASKGMATIVDIGTLSSDKLYEAIVTVVDNPSYKENAMRLSRIHRDTPMSPGDTAVFWIEHVIKHGGQHLRSEAVNLNIIQYFSLDVIAFLCLILLIVIFILKKMCIVLYKICCRRTTTKEKTN